MVLKNWKKMLTPKQARKLGGVCKVEEGIEKTIKFLLTYWKSTTNSTRIWYAHKFG